MKLMLLFLQIIALLCDYLDVDNLELTTLSNVEPGMSQLGGVASGSDLLDVAGGLDLNEAFKPPGLRQRLLGAGAAPTRNKALFLFSHSKQHAIMYDVGVDSNQKKTSGQDQGVSLGGLRDSRLIERDQLVCRPRLENLTAVYATLNKYAKLVEISLAEKPCELKHWLNDLVQQNYMMSVQSRLLGTLNAFARSLDVLQILSDPKQHAELRIDKPQILHVRIYVYILVFFRFILSHFFINSPTDAAIFPPLTYFLHLVNF